MSIMHGRTSLVTFTSTSINISVTDICLFAMQMHFYDYGISRYVRGHAPTNELQSRPMILEQFVDRFMSISRYGGFVAQWELLISAISRKYDIDITQATTLVEPYSQSQRERFYGKDIVMYEHMILITSSSTRLYIVHLTFETSLCVHSLFLFILPCPMYRSTRMYHGIHLYLSWSLPCIVPVVSTFHMYTLCSLCRRQLTNGCAPYRGTTSCRRHSTCK